MEDIVYINKSLFIFFNLVINDIFGLNICLFFLIVVDEVSVIVWGVGFVDEICEEWVVWINGLILFIGLGGFGIFDDVEIFEFC